IEHYTISGKPTLPRVTGRRATFSQNTAGERVSPAGAAAAVPGAVWAGGAVAGLPLRSVLLQRLRQNGVPGWRPGVVLRYGQGAATPWQLTPYLYLSQARR